MTKYTWEAPDILKWVIAAHAKLFIIKFFSSKPSAKMANVGKLLWAKTSYIVFVWVQVYLWLPEHVVAYEFHRHWGFVYIVGRHLYRSTSFGYAYINCHRVLELLLSYCLTKFLPSLQASSYRYWLYSIRLTALLSHYPCKIIVDLFRLHDGY